MNQPRVPSPQWLTKSRADLRALRTIIEGVDGWLKHIIDGEQLVANAETPIAEPDDSIPESELAYLDSQFVEHLEDTFAPSLYGSAVLLIVSTFESEMMRLCRYIGDQRKLPIPIGKLQGSSLDRVQLYLTRLTDWPFPADSRWSWVQDLFQVRHCIAHWGGRLSEIPDSELRWQLKVLGSIAKRRPGITIEKEHELTAEDISAALGENVESREEVERRLLGVSLVVGREFCLAALDETNAVFDTLYSGFRP